MFDGDNTITEPITATSFHWNEMSQTVDSSMRCDIDNSFDRFCIKRIKSVFFSNL